MILRIIASCNCGHLWVEVPFKHRAANDNGDLDEKSTTSS